RLNLAVLYRDQGRYGEAEPLLRRCLEIHKEQLGAYHPETANALNNLAGLYYYQGRFDETEPLFRRSLEIHGKQLGANHPDTVGDLKNLAYLYRAQGRYREAAPLVERSISSETAHWRRTLAYFSERECLEFQRAQSPLVLPGNQGSGRLAAEAQLF